MKIGFVGLGAMGRRMAARLLVAEHDVAGFDLDAVALERLGAAGGRPALTAASACDGAEAAVLMVVDAAQAEAALFGKGGVVEGLPRGGLVVASMTMPPAAAEALGARVNAAGLDYLDAPVSGGTAGAETGTLSFMASGTDAAFRRADPLLDAMGRGVFRCGDRPGQGSTMKMVHQLAAGANLAVAAEVMSFGARLGLDGDMLLDVLNASAGGSWMIADRAPRMLSEPGEAKSAVDIFVKDLGIVLDAARVARFPVPVAGAALQVFLGASGAGFGAADDSQAVQFYERLGGKPVRRNGKG